MKQKSFEVHRSIRITLLAVMAVMILSACAKEPDVEQIKSDLVGQKISTMSVYWSVDSLSEFKSFKIINKTKQSDILEFDVAIDFEGIRTMAPGSVVKVVYRKADGKWKIASTSAVKLKVVNK